MGRQGGQPGRGLAAYFLELTYPSGGKFTRLSSRQRCRVTPDTLPYPPFHPNL